MKSESQNLEVVTDSEPIDFELTELLGEKPSEFLILHLNGQPLEGFGTPYNTPKNREFWQGLVADLNDREKPLWRDFWRNWGTNIIAQFRLPDTTLSFDFRPVVTLKISRVCHGYSKYLHCAIGLFETLADQINSWRISRIDSKSLVEITALDHVLFQEISPSTSLAICKTVIEFLKSNPVLPK